MSKWRKVVCPKCGSDQCFPTFFRNDAQCFKCETEFNMRGYDSWWDKIMRRFIYPHITI